MNPEELIAICNPVRKAGTAPEHLGRLRSDSRQVEPGDIFIAIHGLRTDGHDHIESAIGRGASVIIAERVPEYGHDQVFLLLVPSTRSLLGPLAQAFEGNPARKLSTVGITGTNGKTTVATLVWQILQNSGRRAGLLGTVCKQIGETRLGSRLTTADPIEIAADMRAMVDGECTAVAMEVSSHALDQERTAGIGWDVAAFTNLGHDHLDYHKSMESYVAAKRKLFLSLDSDATAVLNADDPLAKEMARDCRAEIVDFGFEKEADVRCRILESGARGIRIDAGGIELNSPLTGRFNAYNIVESMLICRNLGCEEERMVRAIETAKGAPGRLESVHRPDESSARPAVFVDYAHTPDALANVASTLAGLRQPGSELQIVFGCGGDRDRTKRPKMASVAEKYADRIVVTSDNPRSENPEAIIEEIEAGFTARTGRKSIVSREEAIRYAVASASPGDLVLIAGKGHETYQEINGKRIHFDDREIARDALDNYENRLSGRNREVC